MTHSDTDPCPFRADNFPTTEYLTCCSFRAKFVVAHLVCLGEEEIGHLLMEDLSLGAARAFADVVRSAAARIERRYAKRTGPSSDVIRWCSDSEATITAVSEPLLEHSLASIRKAADWYQKVGDLGFDVVVLR